MLKCFSKTSFNFASRRLLILVRYLETFPNRFGRILLDWRIEINVLKSTALLFAKTTVKCPKAVYSPVFRTANTMGGNTTVPRGYA